MSGVPWVTWATLVVSVVAVVVSRRYALMARRALEETRELRRGGDAGS